MGPEKHPRARFVVLTEMNDYRLGLAGKIGAAVALNVSNGNLREVQQQFGMKEGFDVGLEMSSNSRAFRDVFDNMCHGGKLALLCIPAHQMPVD